jgi:hypothetical protein
VPSRKNGESQFIASPLIFRRIRRGGKMKEEDKSGGAHNEARQEWKRQQHSL